MSYLVALQSAAFYFLACSPCLGLRQRSKARARAKREREEKDRLEAEHPGLYRQPSPFNTSPHWDEEIMMGPSLPRKAYKNTSQRRLTVGSSSSGKEDSAFTVASTRSNSTIAMMSGGTTATATTATTPTTMSMAPRAATSPAVLMSTASSSQPPRLSSTSGGAADDAVSLSIAGSGSGSSTWNLKRYQREDEELWGYTAHHGAEQLARTGHKLMDAIVKAGSSAGRLLDSTLGKEVATKEVTNQARRDFYSPSFRNPPVNDYHPPVVSSRPAHRDGSRWMLQPPPPVKVMEAKVPVSRSTSLTSTVSSSRRSLVVGETGLGRVVGERLMGSKIRSSSEAGANGALASTPASAPTRSRRATVSSSRSKRSQRSKSGRSDSDGSSDEGMRTPPLRRTKRRTTATRSTATTPDAESEDDEDPDWYVATTQSPPLLSSSTSQQQAQGQAQAQAQAQAHHHHHAARRPGLATILSSETSAVPAKGVPVPLQGVLVDVDPMASSRPEQ